jgi:hypothetical protein
MCVQLCHPSFREFGRATQERSVPTSDPHHTIQVISEQIGLCLHFAPGRLSMSSIEGDGINDEQDGNRRRYCQQRTHV